MSEPIEAYPEAAAILRDAGWLPHNRWGVYTRGTLVMGFDHNGGFHIKDWSRIRPGDSEYGPDTPDEAHEAAAWLVAKFPARVQTPGHEGDGETGEEGPDQSGEDELSGDLLTSVPEGGAGVDEFAGSQFIFGDNLDQRRTAAIGLVMQAALARMPAWTDTDTARLSELRNFAMGVSEGRWNDDAAARDELEALESRLRLRSQIVAHRDALVEFLNAASREEVEAFDPEQGWP